MAEGLVKSETKRLRILGALLINLEEHADQRGSFIEVWRDSWLEGARPPLQANISISRAGVLRGLHYHLKQSDYWVLVKGKVVVGLHDFRESSVTRGESQLIELSAERPQALFIPPGVLHGYYAVEDCILMYLVDRVYDGTDEHGVAWNDEDVALNWPDPDPLLSARDAANPRLSEVRPEVRPR